MKYQVKQDDTWTSIASNTTIGGAAYATALAQVNGWPVGTDGDYNGTAFTVDETTTPVFWLMDTIDIPDAWLKTSQPISSTKWILAVGIAAAVYIFLDKKHYRF